MLEHKENSKVMAYPGPMSGMCSLREEEARLQCLHLASIQMNAWQFRGMLDTFIPPANLQLTYNWEKTVVSLMGSVGNQNPLVWNVCTRADLCKCTAHTLLRCPYILGHEHWRGWSSKTPCQGIPDAGGPFQRDLTSTFAFEHSWGTAF